MATLGKTKGVCGLRSVFKGLREKGTKEGIGINVHQNRYLSRPMIWFTIFSVLVLQGVLGKLFSLPPPGGAVWFP